MTDLRLDLKVCEGCGTLWLRKCDGGGVYCGFCVKVLADFPPVRAGGEARKPRLARVSRHTAKQGNDTGVAGGAR